LGTLNRRNHLTPGDRVAWFDPNFAKVPRFGSNDRTKPEPNPNDFRRTYWGERSCKHRSPCLVGSTTGLGSSNARLLARRPASTASQMRPPRRSHLRTVEARIRALCLRWARRLYASLLADTLRTGSMWSMGVESGRLSTMPRARIDRLWFKCTWTETDSADTRLQWTAVQHTLNLGNS